VQFSESGEPTIRYEREEPQVRINQAEGQPEVRIERTGEREQAAADQPSRQTQTDQAAQQAAATGEEQPQTTGSVARAVRVSNLLEADVFSQQGNEVGTVEQVMVNPETGDTAIVVGLNSPAVEEARQIGVSVEDLQMRGDQLVLRLSEDQLRQAPEWREQEGFQEAAADQSAKISTQAQ
jgi:sporulation protein YlmC with PRC-barrel domain